MKFQLFTSGPASSTIDALYGAIVAQARLPSFYLTYGVADTVEGRFDMIVLHLVLLFRRLAREPELSRSLGQGVFDRFCRDMDHNLREMGVGDLSVPKHMRRLAEAFYGRAGAYEQALASADDGLLTAALARNVFSDPGSEADEALRLANYVREAERHLDRSDASSFTEGALGFPDPDGVAIAAA
jgi:cytochrome b pre-mRNA-processing protein 3